MAVGILPSDVLPSLPYRYRCENVACDGYGHEKNALLPLFQTSLVNGPSPTIRTSLLVGIVTVELR